MITEIPIEAERASLVSEPKQPVARLLDLTHGWASFVAHQEAEYGDTLPSDDLYALYEEAAQIASEDDAERQASAVRAFVETRIIPCLLTGKP